MTRVKICGITNIEDARAAVDYGADALGFIFVPGSARYVAKSADLPFMLMGLCPFVQRVGVFTGAEPIRQELVREVDCLQFYDPTFPPIPGKGHIPAFRIRNAGSLDEIEAAIRRHDTPALEWAAVFLLDAYHPGKLGGSGETFNWELAVEAKRRFAKPIILAGGLTPDNVEEAIATVRPYAVDVSSGVEAEPGRKDHARLRAFIRAVRKADKVTG